MSPVILQLCVRLSNPALPPSVASYIVTQSQSTGISEQALELALLGLEIRVAANVLLGNVDVGDGALAADLLEGVLDGAAVRLLVELEEEVLGTSAVEQLLGRLAVRAVGLGEDSCERGAGSKLAYMSRIYNSPSHGPGSP